MSAVDKWQEQVSTQVSAYGAFEGAGERWSTFFKGLAIAFVLLGIGVWYITDNWLPLVGMLPCSVIMFFFSRQLRRRSQAAAEVHAKGKALKHWFKEIGRASCRERV